MRSLRFLAVSYIPLLLAGSTLAAQSARGDPDPEPSGFSIAAQASAAFPVGDFADVVKTGWQGAARAEYQPHGPLGVYLGVRYASFPAEDLLVDDDLTMLAPEAGVILRSRRASGVRPSLRLGVFRPRFSLAGEHDGAGVGLTAGVGAEVAVGGGFSVAADFDGDICGNGPHFPPFGPHPPRPRWWSVGLQARLAI